jgi:hypothetical protein
MVSQSGATGGLRARLESFLDRLLARPAIQRLDPYLGVSELRRINPLLALIPIGVMAALGARTSEFGHMDTVGGIFPIMSLISALNPFVGLLSGLAYGVADLLQKFIVDDIFYHGDTAGIDYWGARVGYLIAYSSMIMFGLVPGVLARIGGRVGERVVVRSAARGADVAQVSPKALRTGRMVGAAVGGIAGGVGSALAYQATAAPAFLLRATPDVSCYALSRTNVTAAIPAVTVAAGGGGAGSVSARGGGPPWVVLATAAAGAAVSAAPSAQPTTSDAFRNAASQACMDLKIANQRAETAARQASDAQSRLDDLRKIGKDKHSYVEKVARPALLAQRQWSASLATLSGAGSLAAGTSPEVLAGVLAAKYGWVMGPLVPVLATMALAATAGTIWYNAPSLDQIDDALAKVHAALDQDIATASESLQKYLDAANADYEAAAASARGAAGRVAQLEGAMSTQVPPVSFTPCATNVFVR